ncbi:hypothetical protein [Gilvibacter sediminis]|uniref:hypothetical protein n=1 Tax=Gilvibacter sediminis TaxID=379071 RepID=UPI0023504477|nr:hypothetical protein [Gilvibacter sediminis]MDC7996508.1 hypothetical protein [Gilvibacter sediminis]
MQENYPSETKECPNCYVEIQGKPMACVACEYPLEGTPEQQKKFMASKAHLLKEQKRATKVIAEARNILFLAGAFELFGGVYNWFQQEDVLALVFSGVLFLVYLLLGYWSQSNPLEALIGGMAFFLLLVLISGMLNPESLGKGIIFRIIVLVLLAKGINSALALKKKY